MKRTLPLLATFVLAGCDHYVDLTPRSFDQGRMPRAQFLADNAKCEESAEAVRRAGGNGDPHGIYNSHYRGCMLAKGYTLVAPNTFDAKG